MQAYELSRKPLMMHEFLSLAYVTFGNWGGIIIYGLFATFALWVSLAVRAK